MTATIIHPAKLPLRGVIYTLFFLISLFPAPILTAVENPTIWFENLKKMLKADGFDPEKIAPLYNRPDVRFDSRSVSLFFMHSESKLNYGQFETPKSIKQAKKYQQTHAESLARTEKAYGVDQEVITAIILVETRLGERLGNSLVFNTLSTMAALESEDARERLWRMIPADRRLSRERFEQKADKKSGWAYTELKALLRYTLAEGIDPTIIRGSYAGAMGICQFMPSNIDRLAVDGNGDGRVDLFDHDDAIASIANYLKHFGWKTGLNQKSAYKIVRRYNNSQPYAETILTVAKLLRS
jgi:membrane-bound lytic murein transglycosylase B